MSDRVRLHSPYYLDILSGYHYPDILHGEFTKFTKMKYPDINIQIKYPNKLINADTPLVCQYHVSGQV